MNTLNSFSKNEETVESDDLNLEFFETVRYCIFEYRNIFFFFFFLGENTDIPNIFETSECCSQQEFLPWQKLLDGSNYLHLWP